MIKLSLAKSKSNSIEVQISKVLIDSNINNKNKINNLHQEFYDIKQKIKSSDDKQKFKLYIRL